MEDYSFSKFADLDFYKRINARLLDLADVRKQRRIVDLGCGTGGVTRMILDRLDAARQTVIFAIDHSAAAIRQAMADLGDRKVAVVKFIQGDASHLADTLREQVDTVVYCNSIHYVPDKELLLSQIKHALRPGGTLAFNSSFFEGSHPPESLEFYRRWMMRSLRKLRREYGLKPTKAGRAEARQHLSVAQYDDLLQKNGFEVTRQEVVRVPVPVEGWIDISRFKDFIEGVMPGVPLPSASQSLQAGVREIYDEMKIQFVPRNWLNIVATRVP